MVVKRPSEQCWKLHKNYTNGWLDVAQWHRWLALAWSVWAMDVLRKLNTLFQDGTPYVLVKAAHSVHMPEKFFRLLEFSVLLWS